MDEIWVWKGELIGKTGRGAVALHSDGTVTGVSPEGALASGWVRAGAQQRGNDADG